MIKDKLRFSSSLKILIQGVCLTAPPHDAGGACACPMCQGFLVHYERAGLFLDPLTLFLDPKPFFWTLTLFLDPQPSFWTLGSEKKSITIFLDPARNSFPFFFGPSKSFRWTLKPFFWTRLLFFWTLPFFSYPFFGRTGHCGVPIFTVFLET